MHLLKTWSFRGENICITGLLRGRTEVTELCLLGSCSWLCILNPNPLSDISCLREGPGLTQPAQEQVQQAGRWGLPCQSSAVEPHPCLFPWVLPCLLSTAASSAGSFALCWPPLWLVHWSSRVRKCTEFPRVPGGLNPPLCLLKPLCCFVTLNTGGDCCRIAWATVFCRVLNKTAPSIFNPRTPPLHRYQGRWIHFGSWTGVQVWVKDVML